MLISRGFWLNSSPFSLAPSSRRKYRGSQSLHLNYLLDFQKSITMSYFPVPVIHPEPFARHVLEVREYQYNAARQTYERVYYRPIQICEPEDNPIDNIEGLNIISCSADPCGGLRPRSSGFYEILS